MDFILEINLILRNYRERGTIGKYTLLISVSDHASSNCDDVGRQNEWQLIIL